MGIYDTDLRARAHDATRANASAVNETQRLLKILLATLNKAVHQGSLPVQSNHGEPSAPAALEPEPEPRHQNELTSHTNYTEVGPFARPLSAAPRSVAAASSRPLCPRIHLTLIDSQRWQETKAKHTIIDSFITDT